jgi:hypothetical protein
MILFSMANVAFSLVVYMLAKRNSVNVCVHAFTGAKAIVSFIVLIFLLF